MSRLHPSHNLYAAVGGLLAFIILVLAAPLIATATGDGPTAPNYVLSGDATNHGSATTVFTSTTSSASGAWQFGSSGNGGLAMFVGCTGGGSCRAISATGGRQGVRGESKQTIVGLESYGVVGISQGDGGLAAGGYFSSTKGSGLIAESGQSIALRATSNGIGVLGTTLSTGGNAAVIGQATINLTSSLGIGVRGHSQGGLGIGVLGTSPGKGVVGNGLGGSSSYGGYFTATAGIGLYGSSSSKFGIFGESSTSIAVLGISSKNIGVEAKSDQSTGLVAVTNHGTIALRASNNSGKAGSFAGIFDGDVQINGNLTCSPACVAAMGVSTDKGERLVYAEAGTQSRLSDEGSATLKDGRAVVKIDPLYAQTVSLAGGYAVYLTPASFDTAGLAVGNQTATSFEVRELNAGKGNYSFYWRISALRKGHEGARLGPAPAVPAADASQ